MIPAVILCGGKGTRLRGVLDDRPKCLAPIGGRTFLDLFTTFLHRQGIDEFVFATGYRHEQVAEWLAAEKRPWRAALSQEMEQLGTGGALRLAAQRITHDKFLAFNGDTFLEINCARLLARHTEAGSPITLAAVEVPDTSAFGRLQVINGYALEFCEKSVSGPGFINAGAYILNKAFVVSQPQGQLSLEKDVLPRTAPPPAVFFAEGRFLDIGTPQRLAEASSWVDTFY